MVRGDFHVHTIYSDGKSTPEEVVESAVRRGMTVLGFSDHSYTEIDERYCVLRSKTEEYKREIRALAERYKDRLRILCGVEQDLAGGIPQGFDYSIGSVHYWYLPEETIPVDESVRFHAYAAERYFHGDIYSLIEAYYENIPLVAEKNHADIVGHFDLVTKFIEKTPMFDIAHPRYIKAWQKAADRLLAAHVLFEINTGGISRGYRTTPYPAPDIVRYVAERGGKFILGSDSHHADTLMYMFDRFGPIYRDVLAEHWKGF